MDADLLADYNGARHTHNGDGLCQYVKRYYLHYQIFEAVFLFLRSRFRSALQLASALA